ncbi:hypothetical protein ACE7GA_07830 [Roseomonas sp. CCTCC AB2023176]|uniref:hypothetical protein n=1 Tax=Roseomonas sp. CCTCC AB2023176 TaxID=3342640 RepID=UPI0035DAED7A
MSDAPQNATAPHAPGPPTLLPLPRPTAAAGQHARLPPRETANLIRSVQALRLFAEAHGHVEAELLVRELLAEVTARG